MPRTSPPMKGIDPEILIKRALRMTGGNQSDLAKALGVTGSAIREWRLKSDWLPPLYAHRFTKVFARRIEQQQKLLQQI